MSRPPFAAQTASPKARLAEHAWNTRDPARVALAPSRAGRWCTRSEFFTAHAAGAAFPRCQWQVEPAHSGLSDLRL